MNISLIRRQLEEISIKCEPIIGVLFVGQSRGEPDHYSAAIYRREKLGKPLRTVLLRGGVAYLSFADCGALDRFDAAMAEIGDQWLLSIFDGIKPIRDPSKPPIFICDDVAGRLLEILLKPEPAAVANPGWLTITDAAKLANVDKGVISTAAKDGRIIDNRKFGRERRVDPASLNAWMLGRADRPREESIPEIEQRIAEERKAKVSLTHKQQIRQDLLHRVDTGTL